MKTISKTFFLTLSGLLIFVLISLVILGWIVFTPSKLTPIVGKYADKYIPYSNKFGEVELTFYKTFPNFGIRIKDFSIISKNDELSENTLLSVNELIAEIDALALWKNNELIITKFNFNDGELNIFIDSLGHSNYELFLNEAENNSESSSDPGLNFIKLNNIEFKNFDLSYIDISSKQNASLKKIKAILSGEYHNDKIKALIRLNNAITSFSYDGEKYLDSTEILLKIPLEINLDSQLVKLKNAFASVDGSSFTLNGSMENDTIQNLLITDLHFNTDPWRLEKIIDLIPAGYLEEYNSIDLSGEISLEGSIFGFFSDSIMPLIKLDLSLNEVSFNYDYLPFPLKSINGNIQVYADLNNQMDSDMQIEYLEIRTPSSYFKTKGHITDLFDDMNLELMSEADVETEEFNFFIPDSMKLNISGKIKGKLSSDFKLSQLNDMALEKMKISASLALSDFELEYDSISLLTSQSGLEISLPLTYSSVKNTSFASFHIRSDDLKASKDGEFDIKMKNSSLYAEMSDIRDTSFFYNIYCTFNMDSISGEMDSIYFALNKPMGYLHLSPVIERPKEPAIELAYTSYDIMTAIGKDSAFIEDITFYANAFSDQSQEDIFLQWPLNGFLKLNNGNIYLSSFSDVLNIPSLSMEFEPENFNIRTCTFKMDKSDFQFVGSLNNILSYFRGDSILMGDFTINSNNTDLAKLMALTNGIGSEEESEDNTEIAEATNSEGPYIVPKGIDLSLKTNILNASLGLDTITNIIGDIRISDGILILDDLRLTTPAADMQLTAMYRTPRKNHLYLGIDYHMFDIEISRLLQMIPDIDTLMPMLRSFEGSGEFHLAAETYLDSLYNIKKSTLRGASSIKGTDLVIMDGETFSEIARTLRFSKKARNRVDSLSAEFTVFREEIDVYPFLIVMDRYKAIIAGRHNFDMSFDYHISLIDSPIPIKLGIDILGTEDDLKYRLASPKYAEFYRPVSRKTVETQQLELRRIIREALLSNVRQ